jgi:hypothetical protein
MSHRTGIGKDEPTMRRITAALMVALTLLITSQGIGAAQNATPEAPNPELCTLEALTREQVEAVLASPLVEPEIYSESQPGTPVALPAEGEPVDEETQQSIEESMFVNIACINTGEPLRQMAVYTDEGRKRLLGATETITDEEYAMVQTPNPLDESGWTVIHEISQAVTLEDGKVAVIIVGDDPTNEGPPSPTLFILVEQDGHWYIDSFERSQD